MFSDLGFGKFDFTFFDGRRDRTKLGAAMRGDRRNAGGEARRQCCEDDLGRRGAVVLRGEHLWMIGIDRVGDPVHVVLAEAEEVGDRGAAVRAGHPLIAGTPGELCCPRCVRERLSSATKCLDVDAIVNGGRFGIGHGFPPEGARMGLGCRPLCARLVEEVMENV